VTAGATGAAPALLVPAALMLAALAVVPALRERYDEDWFRNARVADPIRDACARGNPMTAAAFCAEQGAAWDAASARAIELVA